MSNESLNDLIQRKSDTVRAILNILIESPYFYRSDDPSEQHFQFLLRYRREFEEFFKMYYGWDLVFDQLPRAKSARVFKDRWYNRAITEGKRQWFRFTKRDECLAFMLLLEFFEQQLDEQNMSVEDSENMRFYFGELLAYTHQRLLGLYPDMTEYYTLERVRKIFREIMPKLEQYRLLLKLTAEKGERIKDEQVIYEALPAIYHYNATRLSYPIFKEMDKDSEEIADEY
jgi:hypothetical protein